MAVLVTVPAVAETGVESQSFEIAVQLVVATESDNGMRAHALPKDVFGEREKERGQVEREVQSALEAADVVAQFAVVVLEY